MRLAFRPGARESQESEGQKMARTGAQGLLLVARGVRKVYGTGASEVPALRGVDLAVSRGEFLAVTGSSGSGKTTLLQCLSGLDDVDAGVVTLNGEDVHRLPERRRAAQRAREVGFVFQSLNLLPVFSAVENVEVPLLISGTAPGEARRRARMALERVGLARRLDHRPGELSGGEQQRVAIARALAARPEIVWADEPTGSLDAATTEEVVGLLEELNAEGMTLVLITHDPHVAARANRRVVMRDGGILEDTRPPEPQPAAPHEQEGRPQARPRGRRRSKKK
jgi:putative ABC transport system ATP-binding protein